MNVYRQLSTSNDLETYTVINIPSDKLEELCDAKQPFIAKNDSNPLHDTVGYALGNMESFSIRNTGGHVEKDIPPFNVKRSKAEKIFSSSQNKNKDNTGPKYYSCGNWTESKAACYHIAKIRDSFFMPPMTIFTKNDFLVGEPESHTALRYEIAQSTFIYAFHGNISIKLLPPSETPKLNIVNDYELLEFRSPINPWTETLPNSMEIILEPGSTLFIPPFWNYSAKLEQHAKGHIFQYYTALNTISTIHHHIIHMLQLNNIQTKYDSKNDISFGSDVKNSETIGLGEKKVTFREDEDIQKQPTIENNSNKTENKDEIKTKGKSKKKTPIEKK